MLKQEESKVEAGVVRFASQINALESQRQARLDKVRPKVLELYNRILAVRKDSILCLLSQIFLWRLSYDVDAPSCG